jgi:hypothetical protein
MANVTYPQHRIVQVDVDHANWSDAADAVTLPATPIVGERVTVIALGDASVAGDNVPIDSPDTIYGDVLIATNSGTRTYEAISATEWQLVASTATTAWNLVGSSVNEAVADTVASANIDVPVAASTTAHYAIHVEVEQTGDTDAWQVATTRARRSGSANATVSGASVKDGSGALSISASASTTNLRVSVTPSLGGNVRMNIYVFELVSGATAEFS